MQLAAADDVLIGDLRQIRLHEHAVLAVLEILDKNVLGFRRIPAREEYLAEQSLAHTLIERGVRADVSLEAL